MSSPALGRVAPNATAFVIAHLLPAATSPAHLGSKRWSTQAPLPYWMINRVTGGNDFVSDLPVVRLHTIAASETECQHWMAKADARMMVLVEDPLFEIEMADGSIASCEFAECVEGPRTDPPPYSSVLNTDQASSVVSRLVSTWALGLRFDNADL